MLGLTQHWPLITSSILEHGAANYADAEIVSRIADGRLHRYDYGTADRRARRLASAIRRLGVTADAIVGSLAWTTHRLFELFYAVPGLGAVLHTANPRLAPEQIAYAVNQADYRCLFVDLDCLPIAEAIAPALQRVDRYVIMTDRASMPRTRLRDLICYEDLVADGDEGFAWPPLDERSGSTLCYTSGTTGDPKGVLYSHRGTVLNAMTITGGNGWAIGRGDAILAVAPFFHCNGWGAPYVGPMVGAKLVLPGRALDAASLHGLIVGEGVTIATGVPTVWLGMLDHLVERGGDLGRLDRIVCGGTAPPPAMVARLRQDYGVRTIHAWGMTETTHASTAAQALPGTSEAEELEILRGQGHPLYGSAIRVVDDQGRVLPRDGTSVGHLQVRGHWVARAYFRREDAGLIDAAGWMNTGDVAVIEPGGAMRITDRGKDVIKSGGEWISSVELEKAALEHPDVAEAAVIGVAHPRWQERPLLLVVPAPGRTPGEAELRAWLAERVAKWWLPDAVRLVDELPRTATGKVRKAELRERYADALLARKDGEAPHPRRT